MSKKIIVRLSNGLGNQLFMYASAYAIAKKTNRTLLVDNETAFKSRKSISKYSLSNFNIKSDIASKNYKFLNIWGYLIRKLNKFFDRFRINKKFFIEKKDKNKITNFDPKVFAENSSRNLFLEGHFESEKYFFDYRYEISKEFSFKNMNLFKKSPFYEKLNNSNSISICLRQNRFNEGFNQNNDINLLKSKQYSKEQIDYINASIIFIKKRIDNPIFFLWSNDFTSIDDSFFSESIVKVLHDKQFYEGINRNALDLYLITQAKHHIVIPSTFNWWGAWLCSNKEKIILRPSSNYFSQFKINNNDFWPDTWLKINK